MGSLCSRASSRHCDCDCDCDCCGGGCPCEHGPSRLRPACVDCAHAVCVHLMSCAASVNRCICGCCCCSGNLTWHPLLQPSQSDWVIDEQLCRDRLHDLFSFKILLLGAGESGKSTIIKQLNLIHNRKLQSSELKVVTDSLHRNTLVCCYFLIFLLLVSTSISLYLST